MNRNGQITVIVIVAIVIVGLIAVFFIYRESLFGDNIPASIAPVYTRYSECITEETRNGISLMQSQGGRIDLGDFEFASDFNPFSSHLNFLGFKIPYWYGYSGNNLVINNVPSRSEMENELANFLEGRINDCDFSDFYAKGYNIEKDNPKVLVSINSDTVLVTVDSTIAVSFDEDSSIKNTHNINFNSRLGSLYNAAISINNHERNSLFLENYALDVLQSYAPVDGVEIQCSPKIWKTNEVVEGIKEGLAANIGSIGLSSSSRKDKYFIQNVGVNEPVNLLFLPEAFPSKIEITPATQTTMIAEPLGTQEGLGIMGFCYVPYHFIYDLRFPVLIQIGDGIENFQFPVVVDIDNNLVNSGDISNFVNEDSQDIDLCSFAEGNLIVRTYDTSLNPVSANISYKCFDSICDLGETKLISSNIELNTKIPICVNGELIAKSEGYADSKILFSSNSESFAELILEKEYSVIVEVRLAGKVIRNLTSVVHFVSEDYSTNAIIPENNKVNLKEGLYNIESFVYGNSNIVIPASRKTECFNVNRGGIAGFFGSTKEQCIPIEIPSTKIDYALRGGGKLTDYYILASELQTGKIVIDVSELPTPNSLEQLQYNFEAFNTLGVEVSFG